MKKLLITISLLFIYFKVNPFLVALGKEFRLESPLKTIKLLLAKLIFQGPCWPLI